MSIPQLPPGTPHWINVQWTAQLQLYTKAIGNPAEQARIIQTMQGLVNGANQFIAQSRPAASAMSQMFAQLRAMLAPLQQFIRPALVAAGSGMAMAGTVAAEIGTMLSGAGAAIAGAIMSPYFLLFLLAILLLVLLYWWQDNVHMPAVRLKQYQQMQQRHGSLNPAQTQAVELLAQRESSRMLASFKQAVNQPRGLMKVIESRGQVALG